MPVCQALTIGQIVRLIKYQNQKYATIHQPSAVLRLGPSPTAFLFVLFVPQLPHFCTPVFVPGANKITALDGNLHDLIFAPPHLLPFFPLPSDIMPSGKQWGK